MNNDSRTHQEKADTSCRAIRSFGFLAGLRNLYFREPSDKFQRNGSLSHSTYFPSHAKLLAPRVP